MSAAVRDRIVAFASVVSAICRDAADRLAFRDLAEEVRQDRRIINVAPGDLDGTDLQCLLVNSDMDLPPDPPLGPAMLAGVPLTFSLDLDPGAVDQQVQRPLGAAIWNVHRQSFLATRQRAEVGDSPVQTDQAQQALDEAGRLPERHPKQHLHRKAGLDGAIAVGLPPPALACRRGIPAHLGIKPDRQRAPLFERLIVGRPVHGLVGRGCPFAHADQLPRWSPEMNSISGFVQQSRLNQ